MVPSYRAHVVCVDRRDRKHALLLAIGASHRPIHALQQRVQVLRRCVNERIGSSFPENRSLLQHTRLIHKRSRSPRPLQRLLHVPRIARQEHSTINHEKKRDSIDWSLNTRSISGCSSVSTYSFSFSGSEQSGCNDKTCRSCE